MKNPLDMKPGERLELALNSPRPYSLFQSLPSEDLLLMILDGNHDDVMLAMKYASEEQHREIMDFYVWEKDCIRPDLAMDWLSRLLECGEKKMVKVIRKLDPELLIYVFKHYIHVIFHEDPNEPVSFTEEGLGDPRTMDGQFYYFHKGADFLEVIDSIISRIFTLNYPAYWNLMQGCRYELSMEILEGAFRWRTNRLEERGFADYLESRSIFKEMDERELEGLKLFSGGEPKISITAEEGKVISHSYFCCLPSHSLLKKAMAGLEEGEDAHAVMWETVLIMNKLISANLPSMHDKDQINACLQGGADVLSLALDYLSQGDLNAATEVLKKVKVETLFQAGHSLPRLLIKRLRSFLRESKVVGEETLFLLGQPSADILQGILHSPPLFFDPDAQAHVSFTKMDQLKLVERTLGQAQVLDRLFHEQFKLQLEGLKDLQSHGLYQEELTFSTLLMSGVCHIILDRHFEFRPVPEDRLAEVRRNAFQESEGSWRLKEEYASEFHRWYEEMTRGWEAEDRMLAKGLLEKWLAEFEEEFGSIHSESDIDPRFLKTILVSSGK